MIIGSLRRLMIWVLVLSTWEGAYRLTAFDPATNPDGWRPWVFPAPSHILDALLEMLNIQTAFGEPVGTGWPRPASPGEAAAAPRFAEQPWWSAPLAEALLVSFTRLLIGFAISVVVGMTLGLLMWRFGEVDRFFGPLFLGLQMLPSVCWVPLGILLFGLNETGVLFVLVIGSCFAIAIAMRDGLRTIPPLYQHAGLMLGARGWRLYRYVLLPASLPALATSLRQGFSFAWRSLLGAELLFTAVEHHGLGFLLETGRNFSSVAQVIAVLIVMVVIGMIVDRWVFARLQRAIHARFGLA